MPQWLRKAWDNFRAKFSKVVNYAEGVLGNGWRIAKGIIAIILAIVIIKINIYLAMSLMVIPFSRRVRNEYAKAFVMFVGGIIALMLLTNGVIVFADVAVVILSISMWEMITAWWKCVEYREAVSA
jgi:hypothetical protein